VDFVLHVAMGAESKDPEGPSSAMPMQEVLGMLALPDDFGLRPLAGMSA
jgi:hypothetical protein